MTAKDALIQLRDENAWIVAATQLLRCNREVFRLLCEQAVEDGRKGNIGSAVFSAIVAAEYAVHNHPGVFVDSGLEHLFVRSSEALGDGSRAMTSHSHSKRAVKHKRRVLHVITTAYTLGGHARWAANWILNDPASFHSVVLLRQLREPLPQYLAKAVHSRAGRIIRLDVWPGAVLERARRLRAMARDFDYVVLYTHPSDPCPALAFASGACRSRIILANHAEHLFGIGVTAANTFCNLRQSSADLAAQRRGIAANHLSMLPLPLEMPRRRLSRRDAKLRLGVPEDSVVLLTIGAAYKYSCFAGLDFFDLHRTLMRRDPKLYLLAAGPSPHQRQQVVGDAVDGRVRMLGTRADLRELFEAADLILESYPFGSTTAALQGGSYGNPVLTLMYPRTPLGKIFRTDDPALGGEIVAPCSPEAYSDVILHLSRQHDQRVELGERTARRIGESRAIESWSQALEKVYDSAEQLDRIGAPEPATAEAEVDLLVASLAAASGRSLTPGEIRRGNARLLPVGARIREIMRSSEGQWLRDAKLLVPEWIVARVGSLAGR